MISHVPSFDQLTHEIAKMPGIGPKTAARLAYFILRSSRDSVEKLSQALLAVKERVRECPQCFSYTEEAGTCRICSDPQRANDVLCVVEDPADIYQIDSSGAFRGRYHVLHGTISPLDGIGPNDLTIQDLIDRARQNPSLREIILALDADLEGDTTALYIAKQFAGQELKAENKGFLPNIKLTRIAHGVPIGGDIDFVDHRTLGRALENRIQL